MNKSLADRILLFIEDGTDIYKLIMHPKPWGNDYPKDKQYFYSTINRLKDTGYLEEVEKLGEKRYRTTLKGKAKIMRYFKKDKKWDGKWRIVIFDIPEEKKNMRDHFRKKLGELGFRFLQESVWISPYNIADEIEYLIEICRAKHYVHYLLVEELDNKDVLMKLFKLQGSKPIHK